MEYSAPGTCGAGDDQDETKLDALTRAERAVDRAEARLREAIEAMPHGVVFLDPEGRYILWNKQYAETYQRSADLFHVGARLADTLRQGVERGDYPEAVGREEAWIAEQVPQCGYCQSGMLMAAAALLDKTPKPTDADIDAAITNLCRCGTYQRVRRAIHRAAGSAT